MHLKLWLWLWLSCLSAQTLTFASKSLESMMPCSSTMSTWATEPVWPSTLHTTLQLEGSQSTMRRSSPHDAISLNRFEYAKLYTPLRCPRNTRRTTSSNPKAKLEHPPDPPPPALLDASSSESVAVVAVDAVTLAPPLLDEEDEEEEDDTLKFPSLILLMSHMLRVASREAVMRMARRGS